MAPTIVFDLDGTLVDTARDLVAALNVVLVGDDVAPVDRENEVVMVGLGARAMIEQALRAAGRQPSTQALDRLQAKFLAYYDEHIADHSRPYPGAVAALDRFGAAGWRLAVCTNKFEAPSRKLLDALGLAERFAAIAGQDTFGVRKPDPRHLTETIRAAGGDPNDAVMVGDSRFDVESAHAAGVPVVAVSFGYGPLADQPPPSRTIDRFDDLFGAVADLRRSTGGGQGARLS